MLLKPSGLPLFSSFVVFMLFSFLESWVTGRKRAVLQTGNHYTTAFKIIVFGPVVILLMPATVIYLTFYIVYKDWVYWFNQDLWFPKPRHRGGRRVARRL